MLSKAAFLKSGSGAVPPPSVFGVSVTPSNMTKSVSNGGYTTSAFTANITAGTPPFAYNWSLSPTNGTVTSPSSSSTTLSTGGYREIIYMTLTVTVTDATMSEVTDISYIELTFGTPYASYI